MNAQTNEKYRKAIFIVTYRIESETKKILYLLLKRKLHWIGWEFPKGGIEEGEELFAAVERELKEETGQKAEAIKKFDYTGKYLYKRKFPDRPGFIGQTYNLFAVEVKSKDIKYDNREHSGYLWKPFEESIKMLTWGSQKKSLKKVNDWITKNNSTKKLK